jgi:arylsulfatase A-like enzyme
VPLIFHFPGQLPEKRVATPAALIDIVPTILELAGIPGRDYFDGISLIPVIKEMKAAPRPIFCESKIDKYDIWTLTVVENQWKYHHDMKARLPDELYDVTQDPGETSNLAGIRNDVMAPLKAAAEQYQANISTAEQEQVAMDKDLQEQLKDLGYVE